REDFSREVTLQRSNGVELGMSFGESASDVVFGPLVGSQASDGDDMERAVGGAISAAVEPMPDCLSRRRWHRANATQGCEAGLRPQSFRIVAGRKEELGCSDVADRISGD